VSPIFVGSFLMPYELLIIQIFQINPVC
jgi:hypothetical protein